MKVIKNSTEKTTLLYYENIDGGGIETRQEFSNIIKKYGRYKQYTNAHEWCAGHGAIGFKLLDDNICNNLLLTDKFEPAVESCKFTIASNNIEHCANALRIDSISDLPLTNNKWNLFVANPPWQSVFRSGPGWPEMNDRDMGIRFDLEWKTHKEMFSSISAYLADNAEIFLYEDSRYSNKNTWLPEITNAGLTIVDEYLEFDPQCNGTGYILHLIKES